MCRRMPSPFLAFQLVGLHFSHLLRAENPVAPDFSAPRRKIGPDHLFFYWASIGHKPRKRFPMARDLDRLPVIYPSGNPTEVVPEIGNIAVGMIESSIVLAAPSIQEFHPMLLPGKIG